MSIKELDNAMSFYEDFFNEPFPVFYLKGKTVEENYKIIEKCIKENKTVWELGILDIKYNLDIRY